MKFRYLNEWARDLPNEPVIELCHRVSQEITDVPTTFEFASPQAKRYYASLRNRVSLWASWWGRRCAYDRKRDVFVLLRIPDKG